MLNLWHAYIRATQVGWDANVVVAMRLMRLAVGGALAQREAQRMAAEKVTAIAEAQAAAISKMITGGGVAAATKSASAVYHRKGGANRRPLYRRSVHVLLSGRRDWRYASAPRMCSSRS